MKLTVKELYNLTEGLNKLMDKELPTSVAFSLQRNFKKVSEEVKASDEVRNKLADKYRDFTDENGKFKDEHKDKQLEYSDELNELMAQEVELDLKPIKLSDLGESIKPRTLGLLEPIITEEEQ